MTTQAQVAEAKPQFVYSRIHIPCGSAISIPITAEKLTAADKAHLAHAIHQHCEVCTKALPLTEEPSP